VDGEEIADIPDAVVAHFDATEEDSTGSISSIDDLGGDFDLSGSCTVIDNGINGLRTYRFDGTDDRMSTDDFVTGTEPFGYIFVAQLQDSTTNNFMIDGRSEDEFRLQDDDGGAWDIRRGNESVGAGGTIDEDEHVFFMEAFDTDRMLLEVDGTEKVDESGGAADLTGITLADRGDHNGNHAEIDFGEIFVTEGHSQSDIDDLKNILKDKWGIDF